MTSTCPICNSELVEGASACTVCGYHVLGVTQSFTPVHVGKASVDDGNDNAMHHYELRIVRGPQTGVDISLREGMLTVGRDPRCDIFLNDMTVSREHAHIEVGQKGCVLRDANSFNGVWVNDRAIETCLLQSGDQIQIGAFCLVYRERV